MTGSYRASIQTRPSVDDLLLGGGWYVGSDGGGIVD
jgi:hypothetical protein